MKFEITRGITFGVRDEMREFRGWIVTVQVWRFQASLWMTKAS